MWPRPGEHPHRAGEPSCASGAKQRVDRRIRGLVFAPARGFPVGFPIGATEKPTSRFANKFKDQFVNETGKPTARPGNTEIILSVEARRTKSVPDPMVSH